MTTIAKRIPRTQMLGNPSCPLLAGLLVLAQGAPARAECEHGTTDVQRAIETAVGPMQSDDPAAFSFATELVANDRLRFISDDASWVGAGLDDPNDTDLEFNKLATAYLLAAYGVKGFLPEPVPLPPSGQFGIPFFVPVSNPFHRSTDEWYPLMAQGYYSICDYLNTSTGVWQCAPSLETKNFFTIAQQGFNPSSPFTEDNFGAGTWGTGTYSRIIDSATDLSPFSNPNTSFSPLWQDGFLGIDRKMLEVWHCPAFENQDGTGVDEMAVPRLLHDLAFGNWRSIEFAKFGVWSHCSASFSGNCDKFVNVFLGGGFNSLARGIEVGMLPQQVSHRLLCDVAEDPEDWVPHMAVELVNILANDLMDSPNAFPGDVLTPSGGRSPFACGVPTDILTLIPGVEFCPNGQLACETVANCTGSWPAGYDCEQGCCLPKEIVK